MDEARAQILGGIQRALKRGPLADADRAACEARLAAPTRNLIPRRSQVPHAEQIEQFAAMATDVAATVARVGTLDDVVDEVADYLAGLNLPTAVKVAPDRALATIPWSKRPTLEVMVGGASDADLTAVTGAVAGIAETGTLMLASGPDAPTGLNFLPENHIVVLRADQVTGVYEDGWDRLRRGGAMPRTVNFITGPSRTGDIEQTIQLGAHGPRRLHIILVEDGG